MNDDGETIRSAADAIIAAQRSRWAQNDASARPAARAQRSMQDAWKRYGRGDTFEQIGTARVDHLPYLIDHRPYLIESVQYSSNPRPPATARLADLLLDHPLLMIAAAVLTAAVVLATLGVQDPWVLIAGTASSTVVGHRAVAARAEREPEQG